MGLRGKGGVFKDETEVFGGFGAEAFFDGVDGAKDEFVDDVDDVVQEGLALVSRGPYIAAFLSD